MGSGQADRRRRAGARAAAGVLVAAFVAGSAITAGAAPRTPPPPTPPEREADIAFDVEAFAHALADLPDPLPDPPTDGSIQHCIDVPAKAATYPLFDGKTFVLPPRRDAELCANASDEGPIWTLSWSGLVQDPDVPGTGGMRAWGLWTLVASDQGWLAALGNLDEGGQYDYQPADWDGERPMSVMHVEGRYLSLSRFTTTTTTTTSRPPLEVDQTTPSAPAAVAAGGAGTAAPAQAVTGTPGYTG